MEENKANPQENLSIVEEAKKIRDEIKAENDRRDKILLEEQKLHAEKMLGSSAGAQIPIVAPPVETPKQYAEKVMKGEIKAQ
jgi:hypothetical protein